MVTAVRVTHKNIPFTLVLVGGLGCGYISSLWDDWEERLAGMVEGGYGLGRESRSDGHAHTAMGWAMHLPTMGLTCPEGM